MAPRFSVLIPAHNRADVIGFAISSVLNQSERDFEILVVGDGCTDGTAEVVRGFPDPRIRWFDLPKAPYFGYANRNVALRQATGEFVAFLGHDDLWLPDHLARLAEEMTRAKAEWAYGRAVWVTPDGIAVPLAADLRDPRELDFFLTVGNCLPACSIVHTRECLDKYGYWPEDVPVAADWRLWVKIIEGGGRRRLAYCPVPTSLHFRAIWKTAATCGSIPLEAALALQAQGFPWPGELKLDVPSGEPEQRVFWDAIANHGYAERLRAGASRLIEQLAWSCLNGEFHVRRECEALVQALTSRVDELSARAPQAAAGPAKGVWRVSPTIR